MYNPKGRSPLRRTGQPERREESERIRDGTHCLCCFRWRKTEKSFLQCWYLNWDDCKVMREWIFLMSVAGFLSLGEGQCKKTTPDKFLALGEAREAMAAQEMVCGLPSSLRSPSVGQSGSGEGPSSGGGGSPEKRGMEREGGCRGQSTKLHLERAAGGEEESCPRHLGCWSSNTLTWKEDSKYHDQSKEETESQPENGRSERLPRDWAEAYSHSLQAKRKPLPVIFKAACTLGDRPTVTSWIQLCLSLLILTITHVQSDKVPVLALGLQGPTGSGPCLCLQAYLPPDPPWPSHSGYVEFLSILRICHLVSLLAL